MPIPQTSDQCKQVLKIKRVSSGYLQQLLQMGIPMEAARSIAVAIAKYDIAQYRPHDLQRKLICHYSASVCRAQLWRPGLLLA